MPGGRCDCLVLTVHEPDKSPPKPLPRKLQKTRAEWLIALTNALTRRLLLPYWPPTIDGLEHLPHGPALLVSNHPTMVDGWVLSAVLPRRLDVFIAPDVQKIPLVGRWLMAMEMLPVNAPGGSLAIARERLALGRWLCVFAEGTHGPGLRPFLSGAALLARETGVPAVPVAIVGNENLLGSHVPFCRGGPIRIRFGAPLRIGDETLVRSPHGCRARCSG